MKKKIIIVGGDPQSINSEIIYKSWKKISRDVRKRIYLISNFNLLERQFKKLGYKISMQKVENVNVKSDSDKLKIINIDLKFHDPFKISIKELQKYVFKCFDLAHQISMNNKVISGMINCPIRKNLLKKKNTGVTEYLASKCRIKNNSEVMLIINEKLSVALITTHQNLKKVSKLINKNLIITKFRSINTNYTKIFSMKPKIAVLGLNPHNAELNKSSEEYKIINPAIKFLKKEGMRINGPYAADTIFINSYKKFDVIVECNDQVLAPFKTLYKFNAINLTLGLNYLRVSPDHGVATDMIGKNKSNPQPS